MLVVCEILFFLLFLGLIVVCILALGNRIFYLASLLLRVGRVFICCLIIR